MTFQSNSGNEGWAQGLFGELVHLMPRPSVLDFSSQRQMDAMRSQVSKGSRLPSGTLREATTQGRQTQSSCPISLVVTQFPCCGCAIDHSSRLHSLAEPSIHCRSITCLVYG